MSNEDLEAKGATFEKHSIISVDCCLIMYCSRQLCFTDFDHFNGLRLYILYINPQELQSSQKCILLVFQNLQEQQLVVLLPEVPGEVSCKHNNMLFSCCDIMLLLQFLLLHSIFYHLIKLCCNGYSLLSESFPRYKGLEFPSVGIVSGAVSFIEVILMCIVEVFSKRNLHLLRYFRCYAFLSVPWHF